MSPSMSQRLGYVENTAVNKTKRPHRNNNNKMIRKRMFNCKTLRGIV